MKKKMLLALIIAASSGLVASAAITMVIKADSDEFWFIGEDTATANGVYLDWKLTSTETAAFGNDEINVPTETMAAGVGVAGWYLSTDGTSLYFMNNVDTHGATVTLRGLGSATRYDYSAKTEDWKTRFEALVTTPTPLALTSDEGFNQEPIEIVAYDAATSSGVDLRAYKTVDGAYVEYTAYDVEEDGEIKLMLLDDDGETTWSTTSAVTASEEQKVTVLVPGLEEGKSYDFKIKDEVGKVWTASDVVVDAMVVKMVREPNMGAELQFNSEPGKTYEIQWVGELGGEWTTVDSVTAGETTYVQVPYPDGEEGKGFFRVQEK